MISDEQYLQFSPYFAQEDVEKGEDRLKFLRLLSTLPQTVKELLISENTIEKIINIGTIFRLDEFDTEALSFVVRKLATGEVSIVQGIDLITSEIGLTEEKANNLLNSIVKDILTPLTSRSEQASKAPPSKIPERSDLKIGPEVNKNNIIDLRNR